VIPGGPDPSRSGTPWSGSSMHFALGDVLREGALQLGVRRRMRRGLERRSPLFWTATLANPSQAFAKQTPLAKDVQTARRMA
jgi:hypothetical protein